MQHGVSAADLREKNPHLHSNYHTLARSLARFGGLCCVVVPDICQKCLVVLPHSVLSPPSLSYAVLFHRHPPPPYRQHLFSYPSLLYTHSSIRPSILPSVIRLFPHQNQVPLLLYDPSAKKRTSVCVLIRFGPYRL